MTIEKQACRFLTKYFTILSLKKVDNQFVVAQKRHSTYFKVLILRIVRSGCSTSIIPKQPFIVLNLGSIQVEFITSFALTLPQGRLVSLPNRNHGAGASTAQKGPPAELPAVFCGKRKVDRASELRRVDKKWDPKQSRFTEAKRGQGLVVLKQ